MSSINWITVVGSAILAVAPMLLPIIPPPFNLIASGLVTLLASYFHLQQPSPKAK